MDLRSYLHLVGHHLQVEIGTVSRDAEVGFNARDASVAAVAQHKQHDECDQEPHCYEQQPPKGGRYLPLRVCFVLRCGSERR